MQSQSTSSNQGIVRMIDDEMIDQTENKENAHTSNLGPEPSPECEQRVENIDRSYAMTPLPIVPLGELWMTRTTPIDDEHDEQSMKLISSDANGLGLGHHHGHGRFTGDEQVNYQWTQPAVLREHGSRGLLVSTQVDPELISLPSEVCMEGGFLCLSQGEGTPTTPLLIEGGSTSLDSPNDPPEESGHSESSNSDRPAPKCRRVDWDETSEPHFPPPPYQESLGGSHKHAPSQFLPWNWGAMWRNLKNPPWTWRVGMSTLIVRTGAAR